MRLSFSTRGWQDLSWDELLKTVEESGMNGVELYDLHKRTDLRQRGAPFDKYGASGAMRQLRDRNIRIPCLDSSIDLSDSSVGLRDLEWLIDTAGSMRIPYVSAVALQDHEDLVLSRIEKLLPAAQKADVTLLIKTTGIYSDTGRLRSVMDGFASDFLAALWDIHHPYRDCGESADATITNLGAYVKHVHLRDSDESGKYYIIGEGSLPVDDMVRALGSIDYDGFISLLWKPEWMEEMDDKDIIFPHFVNYMNRFENTRGKKKRLYPNHDGTGEYIWKKDELLDLTFSQVLDRVVEEFPDQYAFKYTTLDYTRTYEEFRDDVNDFARALVSLGVRPGMKVAIWSTNVPAWYITFWATVKIGAVLVTVNTAYKIHEAEYLLRQSDTHTLVMIESCLDSDYRAIINELCPELAAHDKEQPLHCRKLPFLRNIITVDFRQPGSLTFEEAMARSEMVPLDTVLSMSARVKPDDVCNMQYTSGTTGFPKGVMLTHYNVVNNGKCIGDRMGLSTADRMMIQVPMFHCFGMVLSMTSSMTHGSTVCPMPYFSAKASLACINQEKITCFNGVPTMFIAMFAHEDFAKTDFSHMRTGIMAGANCPPDLMRRAAVEMNMREILSVYGQTESSPGCTMGEVNEPEDLRVETVGSAFPGVECKIIDPETGEDLPDGENGEFVARGFNIMKGYYKMPHATAAAIDKEGWLHSGDICCRTPEGYYKVTGRLKDMIIRGGENLYPREIEEFYLTHKKVRDVQVVGVPDQRYGEEACAWIILKEGESSDDAEMREFGNTHIARHKVPRYFLFVEEFPMNAAGKILKYKMREMSEAMIKQS